MKDSLLFGGMGLPDKGRSTREVSRIKKSIAKLSASLAIPGDGEREVAIVGELADLSRSLPFLAVAIYRSTLQFKFGEGFEVRELTSFIAHASKKIAPAYRVQLWRREVEGLIRADLGNEPELITWFEHNKRELKDILLLLVRVILLEGSEQCHLADELPAQVRAASSDISLNPSQACIVIATIFAGRDVTSVELVGAMKFIELAMAEYG